jgi:hypothetical protein
MATLLCPRCKKPGEAADRAPGDLITCPHCGFHFQSLPATLALDSVDEDEETLRAALPAAFPSAAEALGRPRYRVESRRWTEHDSKLVLLFAVLGLPALALFIFCVVRMNDYFFHREGNFPPGAGFPWINLVVGVFVALPAGLAFCWLGVRSLRKSWRETRAYAVVYPEGFVSYDGVAFTVWRWADVASLNGQAYDFRTLVLFIETKRFLAKHYRLRHRGGAEYQFWNTWGKRARQFGLQVEQETFRLMMPDVIERLNRGESVKFGPLEVKVGGLVYRGQFTAWGDIPPARIDNGRLCLDGVGAGRRDVSILLGDIDNYHVFLRLLERNVGFEDGE